MPWLALILAWGLALLLGVLLGMGVNWLADELPPDELGLGHSLGAWRCRYCGGAFAPRQWSPTWSWLTRQGRCKRCGAPRPARHIIVEWVAGLGLAALWGWAGGPAVRFLPALGLVAFSLLITIIDLEHRLILWRVVWPAALVIGGTQIVTHGWQTTVVGGLAGYGIVLSMFALGQLFSWVIAWWRREALGEVAFGGGDVNLALLVGLAVGWPAVFLALGVTVFSAGLFSLGYILFQTLRGRYNPYTAIPYGPFLILGALTVYLGGPSFATWYLAGRGP